LVRATSDGAPVIKPPTPPATPSMGIANSKLRQEVKRSVSLGTSAGVATAGPSLKPAPRAGQQSLAASIATIGVPSPRTKSTVAIQSPSIPSPAMSRGIVPGASYATALRVGATPGDSETSITDQLLIASLQSDLLQAQGSTGDSIYNGLFTAPNSIIERPPRSLSEPVIQLPDSLGSGFFKNQLIQGQGRGVGALGGAFNPQSPSQAPFGSISPLQKAIRSPLIGALASPVAPLPPLGLAWLSSPATKLATEDSRVIDIPQISTSSSNGEFFPLLPPSNMNIMAGNGVGITGNGAANGDGQPTPLTSQQQQQQQQQYQQQYMQQQQFLQQQMQQMQQAYYMQGLGLNQFNPQQQMGGMQGGYSQGQNQAPNNPGSRETVPSLAAWGAASQQGMQGASQYFDPLQMQNFQQGQGFYNHQQQIAQQPMNQQQQQQYQYQQQQYHMQMQQYHMGLANNSTFNPSGQMQQQQPQYMTQGQPVDQSLGQVPVSGSIPVANSLGLGLAPGSGSASRSGSLLEGNIAVNHSDSGSHSGRNSSHPMVADKDELFLFQDLRLDGDAPEFEPQTPSTTRGW
jgi:hypothetical protein